MKQESLPICYELLIDVSETEKSTIGELLQALGVENFIFGQFDCDIDAEFDPNQSLDELYENNKVHSPLAIYSEDKEYLESIVRALESLLPKVNILQKIETFTIRQFSDQNWRESWRKSFQPVLVGDVFAILPPWETKENFPQKFKIVIDPGMAFGTGQHETTRLCLESMLEFNGVSRFLDVGSGSGILSFGAKYLGASFVVGNDIDSESIRISEENASRNNIENILFMDTPLHDIKENNFDLVVANIQSKPLKKLMPFIFEKLTHSGTALLSGILTTEKEEFCLFLEDLGFKILYTRHLNHWCLIACQRN